jgi:hypothetical protein
MSNPLISLEAITTIVCDKIAATEKHVTGMTIANGKVTLTFNTGNPIEANLPADSDAQTGVVVGSTLTITNTDGSTAIIDLSPYLPAVAPTPIEVSGVTVPLNTGDTAKLVPGCGLQASVAKAGTVVSTSLSIKGLVAPTVAESCLSALYCTSTGAVMAAPEKGGSTITANSPDPYFIGSIPANTLFTPVQNVSIVKTNPFCGLQTAHWSASSALYLILTSAAAVDGTTVMQQVNNVQDAWHQALNGYLYPFLEMKFPRTYSGIINPGASLVTTARNGYYNPDVNPSGRAILSELSLNVTSLSS